MTVTFNDFKNMDFRIGKITKVTEHPNADKLYVMKIDIGGEIKQSVAGLKEYYTKEELLNRDVIVLTNLQPAKLRGVDSEVMLLAAESAGTVSLLTTDKPLPPGAKVL